jgi:putative NADPH-quinone reductase
MARIVIIDGHPHNDENHYVHALARAYGKAARKAHEVRHIELAWLDFPVLRDPADWHGGETPPGLLEAQRDIAWADHVVILYPLWLGDIPALLKAFFEQTLRPGFAVQPQPEGLYTKLLVPKSGRVIVTMGMPAAGYRFFFMSHSLRSLKRNILAFVGIAPVRTTLIGRVASSRARAHGLRKVEQLGRKGI